MRSKRMRTRRRWGVWGMGGVWAGSALRAAATSATATAGMMEGISWGWRGRAVTRWPAGRIWSAAVGGGGAGLQSPPSRSGWAGLLQCVRACASASAGGDSACGLLWGAGGVGSWVSGVCSGGMCGAMGWMGVSGAVGLFAAGFCGLPGVGGGEARSAGGSLAGERRGRPVLRGPGLRSTEGVCWSMGGDWQGVWGWFQVRCVGEPASLQRRACVLSCRKGRLEGNLAVFRGHSKDFADACAYLVHLLVGGGKRVLQG